jgi:hypothetical protein
MKVTLSRYEYSYISNKFVYDPAHLEMDRYEFFQLCTIVRSLMEYEINLLESAETVSNSTQYMLDKWMSLQEDMQWIKDTIRRINAGSLYQYLIVNKTSYDRVMTLWFNL